MVSVLRLSLGSMFMKQNTQAFTHVLMPSKTAPSNSMPHSSPGKRSRIAGVTVSSRGSNTSISTSSPSLSHSQTIMSVRGLPLTLSTRIPHSMPRSSAGDSGTTAMTSAPSPPSGASEPYGAVVDAYAGTVGDDGTTSKVEPPSARSADVRVDSLIGPP